MPKINIDIATPFRIPPYWRSFPVIAGGAAEGRQPEVELSRGVSQCPLSFRNDDTGEWWKFPLEPVISISGGNNIVKRNVLKVDAADIERRGTVKELWSQNDYEITISGVLTADTDTWELPEEHLSTLRSFCEGRKTVAVASPIFTVYNIRQIAIESFEFPFTKGMNNQMFTIKAVSDDFDKSRLLIAK